MPKFIDLTGKRFGRLTAIRQVEKIIVVKVWECKCDCGKTVFLKGERLRTGHTKSCGCLHREVVSNGTNLRHGLTKDTSISRLYHVWVQIKQRCRNPKDRGFMNYGGRGIKFHSAWNDFAAFFKWAKSTGYAPGLTIERINVNGDYEPSNCRWIPRNEQRKNTRRVVRIAYQGKTQLLSEWSKELGIKFSTLYRRIASGIPAETAFQKEAIKRRTL